MKDKEYRIYKYEANGALCFWIPKKVKQILKIDWQDGKLCCWALIDINNTDSKGTDIRFLGTGIDAIYDSTLKEWTYVDTIQDGEFVWHYFAKEHK